MDINYIKYHGRGIMLAESEKGECIVAYFITGRSENSRNRVFEIRDDGVYTSPADAKKVEDASLIIYRAIANIKKGDTEHLVVTNGAQTDVITDFLKDDKSFEEALNTCREEPDKPNYTPRISGIVDFKNGDFEYKLSILKRDENRSDKCRREFFTLKKKKGFAHFIHTYAKDATPLPSFEGEPKLIKIKSDIDEFTEDLWCSLDEDNKISLYVRFIDPKSLEYQERVINKYKKV